MSPPSRPLSYVVQITGVTKTYLTWEVQCRPVHRAHFYLEVQSHTADITLYIPSDFRGDIRFVGSKPSFSGGFMNHIANNVRLNPQRRVGDPVADEVVIGTKGRIQFRVWDVKTGAHESRSRETLKRVFGGTKRSSNAPIDWDFLLDD